MAKKRKKYLVTANSEAFACSLVTSPAVEESFVYFNEEKPLIEKFADEEKHLVTGVVAIPNKPIYRRNKDGEDYDIIFSSEAIESMAKDFMKNYRQHEVTLQHQGSTDGVYLVEQWLKHDKYRDKSAVIGLSEDLPVGSWIQTYYVDSNDVWQRIKSGELQGFSLECMLGLEEFESQIDKIDNQMNIETNDMGFWAKLKSVMQEVFSAEKNESVEELASNSGLTVEEYLEETKAVAEEIAEQKVEEVITVTEPIQPLTEEESAKIEEEAKSASTVSVEETNKVETPDISKLEELIGNLKNEVEALKTMNSGLEDKLKEMSKEPSVKPVKPNAKQSNGDTYTAWREQMRQMIG